MASETSKNPTSLGFVPDGWKIRSIGSLCLKITSGGTPSRKNVLFFANGSVRWFKTQELNDWFIEDSKEMITEDAVKSSSAKLLPPNTILMAMYGDGSTITSLGILKKEATCNQACCAMIADPEQCDYRYLFYSLKYHRAHFIHLATGGAQRNLSGALIRNFLIKVPSLEKQRVISDILGSLDDKIELNRRMNATLEESARALFKSWFVDFDPVRAKMEGRQPEGIDAETAALFPDRLVESELGLIPEGWEIKPLDEVADFLNGLALQKYPAEDDEYLPAIKIRELRQGYADETSDKISPKVDPHYNVDNGDVIFSWSGSLLVDIWSGGVGALNQHLFKVSSEIYPRWFYYFWVVHHLQDFQRIAEGKATTMGHIQRHHLSTAMTCVPPRPLLQALSRIMEPIFDERLGRDANSCTLTTTRDTLLPKLLSGEMQVLGGIHGEASTRFFDF